jgi:hypothetical protein
MAGDGGFVRRYVQKFQALATRIQLKQKVDDELTALVAETKQQAQAWKSDLSREQLLAGIAGQLNLLARVSDPQDSRQADMNARIAFLRAARKMLLEK